MIAAMKQRIFEMTFSASGSGSAGKANPNAAQVANVGAPDGRPLIMRRASRADRHAEHFNPPSNKQ